MFRGAGAKELFIADADTLIAGSTTTWVDWFGDSCDGYFNTECFM